MFLCLYYAPQNMMRIINVTQVYSVAYLYECAGSHEYHEYDFPRRIFHTSKPRVNFAQLKNPSKIKTGIFSCWQIFTHSDLSKEVNATFV